jgi:hypothetical protein
VSKPKHPARALEDAVVQAVTRKLFSLDHDADCKGGALCECVFARVPVAQEGRLAVAHRRYCHIDAARDEAGRAMLAAEARLQAAFVACRRPFLPPGFTPAPDYLEQQRAKSRAFMRLERLQAEVEHRRRRWEDLARLARRAQVVWARLFREEGTTS